MKSWVIACVVLGSVCLILGFGAGAATGVFFNGAEFSEVFVPMFSALGGWVSGAGALAAVGTTLYFYSEQNKENEELIRVSAYMRYDSIRVDVTCQSKTPAFIVDMYIEVDDNTYWFSHVVGKEFDLMLAYKVKHTFELYGFQQELERHYGVNLLDHIHTLSIQTSFHDYRIDENFVNDLPIPK
jgi:hypothetical protein